MKKVYKYMGLLIIMVFSFYYTEKIALLVEEHSPIMKQINKIKDEENISYVNAVIKDDKIIPGKNGLSINKSKSYSVMKSFGTFNSYYLVYDQIKPKISLEDNKDKIIYKGNPTNKNVSFVLDNNKEIEDYLTKNGILYNKTMSNDICYITNKDEIKKCKDKYIVSTNLILTDNTLIDIKNKIDNGSIIFINKSTSVDSLKIILKQIKFKDLNIVTLSELISEENRLQKH